MSLLLKSYENTSFWNFGHFQFVTVLFGFNSTSKFRKSFWSNRVFVGYTVLIFCVISWILVFVTNGSTAVLPSQDEYDSWVSRLFNVQPGIPVNFRILQLSFIGLHLVMAVGWERFWDRRFHPPVKLDNNSDMDRLL